MIEIGRPELILLAPLFIALTLLGHYSAQKLKRSLEIFHYPPVQKLVRIAAKKGVPRRGWRGISLALKIAIIMLITLGLANPVLLTFSERTETVEIPMAEEQDLAGGIVLAIDVSASMGLRDVAQSRLEAANEVLIEFVENSSDKVRFSVVAFDMDLKRSLSLTTNKTRVTSTIDDLVASEALPCLEEFTDIGLGLGTSVDLLAPFAASNKSYAVLLVSDGFANYGYPDPITSAYQASQRASDNNIPVYTFHIGKMGQDSNPELLQTIAEETGGEFIASSSVKELEAMLDFLGKYYVPTKTWSAKVDITTTIPERRELGSILIIGAALIILTLWIGNYKHYRTSF
ncbi:MAG: VWA domain-containing protein [Candidatus Bathyarchaeota archaeon]|nr:MAG: VWA domain-containing protein [Candidatus Bathyarchaeota archaeon]